MIEYPVVQSSETDDLWKARANALRVVGRITDQSDSWMSGTSWRQIISTRVHSFIQTMDPRIVDSLEKRAS